MTEKIVGDMIKAMAKAIRGMPGVKAVSWHRSIDLTPKAETTIEFRAAFDSKPTPNSGSVFNSSIQ
jgi:hypothetical protein